MRVLGYERKKNVFMNYFLLLVSFENLRSMQLGMLMLMLMLTSWRGSSRKVSNLK